MKFYSFFHLNLLYSSLSEADRSQTIKACYWPLLNMAEEGFPLGIELPAVTLEIILETDPAWVDKFRQLLGNGQVELIGSGYSQIIGPLVPAQVNDWNQKIGMEVYNQILGSSPRLVLVNEMAYSAGMVEHYLAAGYDGLIMEWNNPRQYHPEWENEWRYYPQRAAGSGGEPLPLVWADSIAFQKFQRYIHNELSREEYDRFLKTHEGDGRHLPIYSGDAEIFDYRPGRYRTEAQFDHEGSEWRRITDLYRSLQQSSDYELIFPREVLDGLEHHGGGHELALESIEQPIPVKKQEKYNINRWALTGRDDLKINTDCYRIYHDLINRGMGSRDRWKELCFLWSSDFRTHIENARWQKYTAELGRVTGDIRPIDPAKAKETVIDLPFIEGDFEAKSDGRRILLSSKGVALELDVHRGLSIKSCRLSVLGEAPVIGTLEHGYYDDISLAADFYTGHSIIEHPAKHKIADLAPDAHKTFWNGDQLTVSSESHSSEGAVFTKSVSVINDRVLISKTITLPSREAATIRCMNVTFLPEGWDHKTLYLKTHNGGNNPDTFSISGSRIRHTDLLSPLISARHGLGATEGSVIIGDKDKALRFTHATHKAALIPTIVYQPVSEEAFFLRLQYSAQELDETFRTSDKQRTIDIQLTLAPA